LGERILRWFMAGGVGQLPELAQRLEQQIKKKTLHWEGSPGEKKEGHVGGEKQEKEGGEVWGESERSGKEGCREMYVPMTQHAKRNGERSQAHR